MRTQIEADLLLQNLMLIADAMGLGAWIHASIAPPVLLGDPKFRKQYGADAGLRLDRPALEAGRPPALEVPLPSTPTCARTPVGLRHNGEHLIKAMCPPNYADAWPTPSTRSSAGKFGPTASTPTRPLFDRIYKGDFGERYLQEASDYAADVIACTRDICTYIYETHGRFPAHSDAIHVPGVWLQVHHPEKAYYERFFRDGLTDAHRAHDALWHTATGHPEG